MGLSLLDEAVVRKFWENVTPKGEDECWEWEGRSRPSGYGIINWQYNTVKAHRVSLALKLGHDLDRSIQACHVCDNPGCVNPNHLFPGTMSINQLDKVAKNRQARGERAGTSVLTDALVTEARARFQAEPITLARLAAEFGVTHGNMRAVLTGQTWTHLPLPSEPRRYVTPREVTKQLRLPRNYAWSHLQAIPRFLAGDSHHMYLRSDVQKVFPDFK